MYRGKYWGNCQGEMFCGLFSRKVARFHAGLQVCRLTRDTMINADNKHITATLRDTLHWLPISQRVTFKIAVMMFECSRGRCPKYFGDVYTPVHTVAARLRLRSADHGDVVVPRARSTRFGCRSFRVCGPTIWNELPQHQQSTDTREQFKHRLKGWLFECTYGRRCV